MATTTVLLDAGGVILDESEHEKAIAKLIIQTLKPIEDGYCAERYHEDIDQAVKAYCPRTYQYVLWKYLRGDVQLFDELWAKCMNAWEHRRPELRLMNGIAEEIKSISKRFDIALAGQYGKDILSLLDSHGLLDCLSYQLTQDDFAITKPDPRYYEQILAAIGTRGEQSIMVGDRIDKDVIPARQVGMKTIRLRTGLHRNQQPRIPDEIPDVELDNIKGLTKAIMQITG